MRIADRDLSSALRPVANHDRGTAPTGVERDRSDSSGLRPSASLFHSRCEADSPQHLTKPGVWTEGIPEWLHVEQIHLVRAFVARLLEPAQGQIFLSEPESND